MRMPANKDNNGDTDTDNHVYMRNQFEYDRMQSLHEDIVAIERFHEMKDSRADIIIYTVFVFEALVTGFLAGMITEHYYIVHSIKVIVLLPLRWYVFKQIGKHYFMLEFCTWIHTLLMFYIWSPWKPAGMFPALFLFAHGPLIWSVYYWRNAFVPHSSEKMCTLFIHIAPALVTWSIRWYSTPDQGFDLCANPTEPGVNGCNNIGWDELILYPFIIYGIWVSYYVLIVFYWKEKIIKEQKYMTAFAIMSQEKKRGAFYTVTNCLGPKYQKQMYFFAYTVGAGFYTVMAYLCFISLVYNYIFFLGFVLVACYNGATFYIKVVGKEYYKNEEKKNE